MCGIAALIAARGPALEGGAIRAMADAVRHRGPDGEGYALFAGDALEPKVAAGRDTPEECIGAGQPYLPRDRGPSVAANIRIALGHRRLSIVDLSAAGHQPMCYAEGRFWISYNGEIYNHRELRQELEILGHRFVSHSDTEVILAAFAQWGEACLARFNGMFAFVLIDRIKGRVFAARDRFGVKPLYYWVSAQGLIAFASEIKQFTVLHGWKAKLEPQLAYDYLVWGLSDHESGTLFESVFQLRGGQFVSFCLSDMANVQAGGRIPTSVWYELPRTHFTGDFDDAALQFRELLTDSVRLRLRSDVQVGSCLSGGLDSSSIVCLMHDLLKAAGEGSAQKTFTAHAASGRLDERPYASEIVKATGVSPHYVSPTAAELFNSLSRIAWHQDEPFGSTSIFIQWKVFELAAGADMKVMLDGQGADELLGGYPVFWGARFAGLLRKFDLATLAHEIGALKRLQGRPVGDSIMQMGASLLSGKWLESRRRFKEADGRAWFNPGNLQVEKGNPFIRTSGSFRNSIDALSRAQLMLINLPLLLHWEDRNSMAHGIEARVPFLDYRLVEMGLSLPDEFKLQGGWTKRVLRESMLAILPKNIRERRDKIGFEAPEFEWMQANAPAYRTGLERAAAASGGIIDRGGALGLFDQMVSGTIPYSPLPWRLVSFGAWAERFAVDCESGQ